MRCGGTEAIQGKIGGNVAVRPRRDMALQMDYSQFPDPVFAETVLCPQFEGVRKHYAPHIATVNKAYLLMLSTTGILAPEDVTLLASALDAIDRDIDLDALRYTGE